MKDSCLVPIVHRSTCQLCQLYTEIIGLFDIGEKNRYCLLFNPILFRSILISKVILRRIISTEMNNLIVSEAKEGAPENKESDN